MAPAVLLYVWSLSQLQSFGWAVVVLFAMCCALRLARFNAQLGIELPAFAYNFFIGVPAPAAAILAMMPMLLSFQLGDTVFRSPYLNVPVLAGVAALMVSRVPTYSFKRFRVQARLGAADAVGDRRARRFRHHRAVGDAGDDRASCISARSRRATWPIASCAAPPRGAARCPRKPNLPSSRGNSDMSSKLFEPIRLRGLTLPNRIVVAPMCQYSAVDGSATDWHVMHWTQFALGGVGLFVMEATGVSAQGRISPACLGLYSDDNERAMAHALKAAKTYGSAPMGIQLAHAGRKASTYAPGPKGMGALKPEDGAWQTVSASAIPYTDTWHTPLALDHAGLERVKGEFITAAQRAVRIGLDEIELHMAHGYLMQQFLSPLSNHRNDEYGGDLKGRMKYPLEVFAAVRAAIPDAMPLGARINATDWAEGGWTIDEAVMFARVLKDAGLRFRLRLVERLDPGAKNRRRPALSGAVRQTASAKRPA